MEGGQYEGVRGDSINDLKKSLKNEKIALLIVNV